MTKKKCGKYQLIYIECHSNCFAFLTRMGFILQKDKCSTKMLSNQSKVTEPLDSTLRI